MSINVTYSQKSGQEKPSTIKKNPPAPNRPFPNYLYELYGLVDPERLKIIQENAKEKLLKEKRLSEECAKLKKNENDPFMQVTLKQNFDAFSHIEKLQTQKPKSQIQEGIPQKDIENPQISDNSSNIQFPIPPPNSNIISKEAELTQKGLAIDVSKANKNFIPSNIKQKFGDSLEEKVIANQKRDKGNTTLGKELITLMDEINHLEK